MKTFLKVMIFSFAFATTAMTVFAQSKAPVFTTVKTNPITSVKDQNRSGTCWDYATCGFLESEILRKTGKTVDLAEMYVAYQDYLDCADYHIRMHGNSRFSEDGSCDDVSGDNFYRSGIGLALDKQKVYTLAGSDAERWLKLPKAQQKSKLDSLGVDAPEVTPTQALRQKYFDTWESTYDHVMLIFGMAKDKNGKEYYMVKNSWGDYGNYHGIWYLSKSFVAMYTTYIFLNKHALDKSLLEKMAVKF